MDTVCAIDDFCCDTYWDDLCVGYVEQYCNINCSGPCSPETCPDGCCDPESGVCKTSECQFYGVPCGGEDLPGGAGTSTCAHCFQGECETCTDMGCTSCTPDCEGKACGDPDGCGSRCDGPCGAGELCSIALAGCVTGCDPVSCPDGCCAADGACLRNQNDGACGAHGAACAACPVGGPACVPIPGNPPVGSLCQECDSTTCPDGCCTADGHCDESGSHQSCGHAGSACVDCTLDGSICHEWYATCAECWPDCAGKACGDSDGCGGSCEADCGPGLTCVVGSEWVPSGCHPCGPTTCPYGCCDGDGHCVSGSHQHTCGAGGQACMDCGNQACDWGVIQAQCVPCGTDCFPPLPGDPYCQADGCGGVCPGANCTGGGDCQVGPDGWAQCSMPGFCAPWNCAGCCDQSGNCKPGNLPMACGHDGVQCVDCVGLGLSCDAASQTCGGCTPDCAGKWCGAPDGCGGVCTGPGLTCSADMVCSATGTCECPNPGEILCSTPTLACVDVSSNPNQCGGCSSVCPPGAPCVDGHCDCPVGSHLCTTPGGTKICTNLATDDDHCGGCNMACPGTPCIDGACGSCGPGQTACPGACADLTTDEAHCGTCSNACPVGIDCVGGACDCGGGLIACGGACTDVGTDEDHCGACFNACPAGVSCVAGACICPGGSTLCGAVCTNTDVDPDHCGACFAGCSPGQSCVGGMCL